MDKKEKSAVLSCGELSTRSQFNTWACILMVAFLVVSFITTLNGRPSLVGSFMANVSWGKWVLLAIGTVYSLQIIITSNPAESLLSFSVIASEILLLTFFGFSGQAIITKAVGILFFFTLILSIWIEAKWHETWVNSMGKGAITGVFNGLLISVVALLTGYDNGALLLGRAVMCSLGIGLVWGWSYRLPSTISNAIKATFLILVVAAIYFI